VKSVHDPNTTPADLPSEPEKVATPVPATPFLPTITKPVSNAGGPAAVKVADVVDSLPVDESTELDVSAKFAEEEPVVPKREKQSSSAPDSNTIDEALDHNIDIPSLVAEIKEMIEDMLGPGAHSAKGMRQAFSDFDEDGNGKVDRMEFKHAMKKLKIPLGNNEIMSIFTQFDSHHSGFLDYDDFIDLIASGKGMKAV